MFARTRSRRSVVRRDVTMSHVLVARKKLQILKVNHRIFILCMKLKKSVEGNLLFVCFFFVAICFY